METEKLVDQTVNEFIDVMADVELGKNLKKHLLYINEWIEALTVKIDEGAAKGLNHSGIKSLAYEYYRLRDKILSQLAFDFDGFKPHKTDIHVRRID